MRSKEVYLIQSKSENLVQNLIQRYIIYKEEEFNNIL